MPIRLSKLASSAAAIALFGAACASEPAYLAVPPSAPTAVTIDDQELAAQLHAVLAQLGAAAYQVPPEFQGRVRAHLQKMLGSTHLAEQWARKKMYWPQMTPPFRALGLPEDLAYLAFAESRFDPNARSEYGSLGLWQFIPSTAKSFGLVVEGNVDERTDVDKSSAAAAHYLSLLQNELGKDSFLLAIAAYNSGENQMRAALAALAQQPGGLHNDNSDFWGLYTHKLLSEETREYVPAVLAAMILGSNAHRYGLE